MVEENEWANSEAAKDYKKMISGDKSFGGIYIGGIDPYKRRLNWIQRQLQKIGFYKEEPPVVTIFKHSDGRVEQIKNQ